MIVLLLTIIRTISCNRSYTKLTKNQQGKQIIGKRKRQGIQNPFFDTLKNGKTRIVAPAPIVFEVLRKVRREQAENRLKYGSSYNNEMNLVFTNELGEHIGIENLWQCFKRRVTAIGLPDMRFHDLRHTYATLSIQNGDDIKTVSESLGHATVAFTLDVYGHVTDTMRKASADRMQAFIESIGVETRGGTVGVQGLFWA